MNAKLYDAVNTFKNLGWEAVAAENVLALPLPVGEEKQTALAGLKSGEWGEFAELEKNRYGYRSFVDVNEGKLALFAIRLGVDARRAVTIANNGDPEALIAVIQQRGDTYATNFIEYACTSSGRMWEHSASVFGKIAVWLVDRMCLDIPQSVEYLKDWSVYAAVALGLKAETRYKETDFPELECIERRFDEHVRVGVAVNVPATGPFGAVFSAGAKRGWLSREEALALAFLALDTAVRPGDRRIWLQVLDILDVRDEELFERTQALIPLLALSDTSVIARLAPVLIERSSDSLLVEVLLAAFSATTKKARQLVLKAALSRPRPENAEDLAAWLSLFAEDKDKSVASLAKRLISQWEIEVEALAEEEPAVQGLWRETPPLWQAPAFDRGEVSPEALTELAAKLAQQVAGVEDVTTEQFLAVANAVAYQDVEAAKSSLRGLKKLRSEQRLLYYAACLEEGTEPTYGSDEHLKTKTYVQRTHETIMVARDYIAFRHLGELPCLLSTPSIVDLSVTVSDLAERLALYRETGTCALEADLLLALARLNVGTKTPEALEALQKSDVPVVLQSGERMPATAEQAVLSYIEDPFKELAKEAFQHEKYWRGDITVPASLVAFPNRFKGWLNNLYAIFPCWGDGALRGIRSDAEVYHEKGLILRQAARRSTPLPPGASVNMLAAQRYHTPDAAEDAMLAVTEAWERGLLRPGVAEVSLLDWSAKPPSNVAALAAALDGIIQDGVLSVVWPVLDALITASLAAPRLVAGTAEVAELMDRYLPEVLAAVEQGIAEKAALELPGIRALALRGGSSRAVSAAKKVAALLPPAKAATPEVKETMPVLEPPFEVVWPAQNEAAPYLDDKVTVAVEIAPSEKATKHFLFTLTLPAISDRVFKVEKASWDYDLSKEGQCEAYAVPTGTIVSDAGKKSRVWLHWDEAQNALVVCDYRNWADGKDGPLPHRTSTPLSASLLTIIIALLAQDGDARYTAPRMLEQFSKDGQINAEVVRRAMRVLLQHPAVSPAKLVRPLEKDVKHLPTLWPMLTEALKAAGALVAAGEKPPVWVNRVLDSALRSAPYLLEAARRGLISAEDAAWEGLSHLASSKAKQTSVTKAKQFLRQWEESLRPLMHP